MGGCGGLVAASALFIALVSVQHFLKRLFEGIDPFQQFVIVPYPSIRVSRGIYS